MTLSNKSMKILTLALHESAIDGEWQAAAVRFFSLLRKDHTTPELFLGQSKPNTDFHPSFFVMPFGKYKGELISSIPDGYIIWVTENMQLREPLRSHIESELERRGL